MSRLSKTELAERQQKAAFLYVIKGLQLTQIAEQVQVTPRVIKYWKKVQQWKEPVKLTPEQQAAQTLYEKSGIEKQDLAQALNLPVETINQWQVAFGWQEPPP